MRILIRLDRAGKNQIVEDVPDALLRDVDALIDRVVRPMLIVLLHEETPYGPVAPRAHLDEGPADPAVGD